MGATYRGRDGKREGAEEGGVGNGTGWEKVGKGEKGEKEEKGWRYCNRALVICIGYVYSKILEDCGCENGVLMLLM
jgi:hypothetical protein